MAIPNTIPRVQYVASGAQAVFTFPFVVYDDADLSVFVDNALQTLGVNYNVAGVGIVTGGSVNFTFTPAAGAIVTITRSTQPQRDADFQPQGEFQSQVINRELDRLQAQIQELLSNAERTLALAETSAFVGDLGLPEPQANSLLGWNSVPNGLQNYGIGSFAPSTVFLPVPVSQGGTGGITAAQAQTNLELVKGTAPGNVAEVQPNGKLPTALVPEVNNAGSLIFLSRTFA